MCLLSLGHCTAATPLRLLVGGKQYGSTRMQEVRGQDHTPHCLRAQLHRFKPPGTSWNTTISMKRVRCSQKCELGCVRPLPLTQNPHGKELKALLGLGAPPPTPQAGLRRGWCERASLSSHPGSHPGRSHSRPPISLPQNGERPPLSCPGMCRGKS